MTTSRCPDVSARAQRLHLPGHRRITTIARMWNEPYLETCCRSALHRLTLCGPPGRPEVAKDAPCLARLTGMGLASKRGDGRYEITSAGSGRHAREVLRRPSPAP